VDEPSAAAFQSLIAKRDLAAYRAVAAVEMAIHFWEAQDYDATFASLKRAHDDSELANSRVTEFYKSLRGEQKRHGYRPAA
jgi:predicted negative regulator of RcsB-dependent stress response